MTSNLFSNYEVEILSKFRSRNIDVKANFKNMYTNNNVANLECSLNNCFEEEDQEHLLKCKPIIDKLDPKSISNVKYQDLFSNCKKQKKVIKVLVKILDIRKSILEQDRRF